MIEKSVLLSSLEKQLTKKLPFVVYKKAGNSLITAKLQNNSNIDYFKNKDQEGFVFAPFFDSDIPIFFDEKECNTLQSHFNLDINQDQDAIIDYDLADELEYIKSIEQCIETIKNGDIQKIVLSRKEDIPISSLFPIKKFEKLLNLNLNAFCYLWYHPKIGCWIGATPERLIELNGPFYKTMALAGTSLESDTWTKKEIAEHQYVTDFITDRLSSITKTMSISETETVEAGNIFHLKTKISGIIDNDNLDLIKILQSLHPTPAVCGLPMEEAREYILKNEGYNREYYTGYLGEVNIKKDMRSQRNKRNVENQAFFSNSTYSDIYVNLRCMKLTEAIASVYVGGGITKESDPKSEWKETVNKSYMMKQLLSN